MSKNVVPLFSEIKIWFQNRRARERREFCINA
ncbi:hypothetical protein QLX08_006957 [Tetragonisca angustula]|uniref:Homeobox domain-containing protein n=1 Tax=Tetragonisca angustula TaxID=166442 RepID=A0AAW0ZSQ3_9HYME